jgi:hypothetical protein
VSLNIRWIQEFDPSVAGELPEVRLERLVDSWIGRRPGIIALQTAITVGESPTITIDLATDADPLGVDVLRELLHDAFGTDSAITIRTVPITVLEGDLELFPAPALS